MIQARAGQRNLTGSFNEDLILGIIDLMPHIHEKIDLTATAFVVYKDKVLLRLHDKYHVWLGVGGHVELDEDPTQAVVREVKEEVGLDVVLIGDAINNFIPAEGAREIMPPTFMNIHYVNATHQHLDLIYFATTKSDHVVPEGPNEEWKWATKEDLQTMDLRPGVRFYAEQALGALGK
jgi:8-oxo-dGTP pyrophosphatase MutT (NUDIX family)